MILTADQTVLVQSMKYSAVVQLSNKNLQRTAKSQGCTEYAEVEDCIRMT